VPSVVAQIRTANAVRSLKGEKKKKFSKPPKPFSTRNAERTYRSKLASAREPLFEFVRELLIRRLPEIARAAGVRSDGQLTLDVEPWVDSVRELMSDIRARFGDQVREYERIAREAFDETSAKNLASLRKQFRQALGVDVFVNDPTLAQDAQSFIEENVSLVTGADEQAMKEIENIVFRGYRSGRRSEFLAEEIEKRIGISKRRANLIAIDQVQKINGQLTRRRQTDLGLDRYIWRTVLDERVRKEHRRREGRVFSWDDPPPDGHPGEPINCRCFAEPYLEDVLDEASSPPTPRLPR